MHAHETRDTRCIMGTCILRSCMPLSLVMSAFNHNKASSCTNSVWWERSVVSAVNHQHWTLGAIHTVISKINIFSSYTKFLNSFHQLHFHHALIRRCNCHKGRSQGWKLQWRNTIIWVNVASSNTSTPLTHKYLKPRAYKNILMHSCWSLYSAIFSHLMVMPSLVPRPLPDLSAAR